jgi:hypothetical protein
MHRICSATRTQLQQQQQLRETAGRFAARYAQNLHYHAQAVAAAVAKVKGGVIKAIAFQVRRNSKQSMQQLLC